MPRHDSPRSTEEEDVVMQGGETGPAYAVAGYGAPDTSGVHCSAYEEFCFFCAYENNTDAVGTDTDLYGNLVDLAKHLFTERKEPSAIAQHVSHHYTNGVQNHVPGTPAWSVESILRHLLYSRTFEMLEESGISAIFTSLIARQNSGLVDVTTNTVIEEHRKAFCSTVETFIKWRASEKRKR